MTSEKLKLYRRKGEHEVLITLCTIRLSGFGLYITESGNDISIDDFYKSEVKKAITSHFSDRIYNEIKTAADQQTGIVQHNGAYSVSVVPPEIGFGIIDRYGGNGTSCSLEEFLEGNLNDFIIEHFGYSELIEISETARNILVDAGKQIPGKNKFIQSAEIIAEFTDLKADLTFTWEYGKNNEFKYTAQIYIDCILWQRETYRHRTGDVDLAVQSCDDFLKNGAPDLSGFRISLPEKYSDEILEWIELDRSTKS